MPNRSIIAEGESQAFTVEGLIFDRPLTAREVSQLSEVGLNGLDPTCCAPIQHFILAPRVQVIATSSPRGLRSRGIGPEKR